MGNTAWLARRAMLALALMVGFYALALSISVALLWIPYAEWMYLNRIHPKIALGCILSSGAILWAVVPRRDRFDAPGPRLDEVSHRELFAVIREIAAATRQEMPSEVYLVNEVNAWVTHRGGIMGAGSRRVMGIGLPLVEGLSVNELKAVLAHEFGHYAAGDVKLGPWVYKTRAAIGRALQNLGDGLLTKIFDGYGRMFLRMTHAISREQELLADALAARAVSPRAMASALRRTEGLGPAFNAYWHSEVVPALNAGCLPPITSGFRQYLEVDHVSAAVNRLVSASEADGESDAYDTHPPLRERLAALAAIDRESAIARENAPAADPPAARLLRDDEGLARSLVAFAAGPDEMTKLRKVGWNDLARDVYPRRWREAAAQSASFLARYTVGGIPAGRGAFVAAGRELLRTSDADDDLMFRYAVHVFSMGVGVALLDAGFTPDTSPGRPVVFHAAGVRIHAFDDVEGLAEEKISAADWQAKCQAAGIAELPLGAGVAA